MYFIETLPLFWRFLQNCIPFYKSLVVWPSVSNHAGLLVVGTTNHKPTVNSAVHPSEVGNWARRSNSEGTSTGHALITANLKLKCFIQYNDSKWLFMIIYYYCLSFLFIIYDYYLSLSFIVIIYSYYSLSIFYYYYLSSLFIIIICYYYLLLLFIITIHYYHLLLLFIITILYLSSITILQYYLLFIIIYYLSLKPQYRQVKIMNLSMWALSAMSKSSTSFLEMKKELDLKKTQGSS